MTDLFSMAPDMHGSLFLNLLVLYKTLGTASKDWPTSAVYLRGSVTHPAQTKEKPPWSQRCSLCHMVPRELSPDQPLQKHLCKQEPAHCITDVHTATKSVDVRLKRPHPPLWSTSLCYLPPRVWSPTRNHDKSLPTGSCLLSGPPIKSVCFGH